MSKKCGDVCCRDRELGESIDLNKPHVIADITGVEACCRLKEAVETEYSVMLDALEKTAYPLISFNGGARKSTDPEVSLPPSDGCLKQLQDILLGNVVGGGSMDLVWDEVPSGLGFNEYQEKAASTAIYKEGNEGRELFYVALGLAGEAGEFAGEVSKLIRDDKGKLTEDRKNKLISEAGDIFWFLAQTCTELGITMQEVAQANLDKLASRKERGVLNGSGGTR